MFSGVNNNAIEILYQKIQDLQELNMRLESKSINLSEYKRIKDKKMQKLNQKEEFLKSQERNCIQRFKELFDNANNNLLNASEIKINDKNEVPPNLVKNIYGIKEKVSEQFSIIEQREQFLTTREKNINDFIEKLSVEDKEKFKRLESEQRKNPLFTEECLLRINSIPEYARIRSFNINKQVEELKSSFKDIKNIKVMKIIENLFTPSKHNIKQSSNKKQYNYNNEDEDYTKQNENFTSLDNELISQQIDNLLHEMKNKESLENFNNQVNEMSKTNSAYIKPSVNHTKFLNGQRLNKTFNLKQEKRQKEKEAKSRENSYDKKKNVVISQENVARSTSMPSRVMNSKDKNSKDNNRDNSPYAINMNRNVNVLTTSSNVNNIGYNKTDYSDVDVEKALENNQIDLDDMDLLHHTKKNNLAESKNSRNKDYPRGNSASKKNEGTFTSLVDVNKNENKKDKFNSKLFNNAKYDQKVTKTSR